MNQSYSFSKVAFKTFSSLVHHFYPSLSRSGSSIGRVVLIIILNTWRPKKSFVLQILSVLLEMRGSNFLPSSHNIFDCENSFHTDPKHFMSSFHFIPTKAIISGLFVLNVQLSFPTCSGASFKYSLVSSWSIRSHVSKLCQVSLFIFQFFPVNCAFATYIFNSYGGLFKVPLLLVSYQFIRSFLKPTGGSLKTFLKFALYLSLILSTRISSLPIRCLSSI